MVTFDYVMTDAAGMHARPAGQLAKQAMQFQSKIMLQKGEKKTDIRRLIAVMSMGIQQGDTVKVTVEGSDEEQAAAQLAEFFKQNL